MYVCEYLEDLADDSEDTMYCDDFEEYVHTYVPAAPISDPHSQFALCRVSWWSFIPSALPKPTESCSVSAALRTYVPHSGTLRRECVTPISDLCTIIATYVRKHT
jgi:hypothetical protein